MADSNYDPSQDPFFAGIDFGPSTPVANTGGAGTNDTSSPWGSILSNVGTLGNTAANVLKAVNGQPAAKKPASSLTSLLPILAIGGVVLVLLFVVVGRK